LFCTRNSAFKPKTFCLVTLCFVVESLGVFFVVLLPHWLRKIIERDVFGLVLINSELVEIVALNCSPLHYARDNVSRKGSFLLQELDQLLSCHAAPATVE